MIVRSRAGSAIAGTGSTSGNGEAALCVDSALICGATVGTDVETLQQLLRISVIGTVLRCCLFAFVGQQQALRT